MTKQIRLFNKGKSIITGIHPDIEDESKKHYKFLPESTRSFSEAEAKKLRRLYPHGVVSMEDEAKKFDDEPIAEKEQVSMISVTEAEKVKQAAIDAAVAEAIANYKKENSGDSDLNEDGEESASDDSSGDDKSPAKRGRPAKK